MALLLAACGGGDDDGPNRGEAVGDPAPDETTTTTVAARQDYDIGQKVETQAGNTVTVRSFEFRDRIGEFNRAEPGQRFGLANVEFCAGPNPEGGFVDLDGLAFQFTLQMADNTRVPTGPAFQKPELAYEGQLLPRECVAGFLTFEVPRAVNPTYIFVGPPSFTSLIRWRIP